MRREAAWFRDRHERRALERAALRHSNRKQEHQTPDGKRHYQWHNEARAERFRELRYLRCGRNDIANFDDALKVVYAGFAGAILPMNLAPFHRYSDKQGRSLYGAGWDKVFGGKK